MITFTFCLLALVAGYFFYGRFIEHIFGPDDRKTPALTKIDGVDYIPLPTWKIFMIQFLNIAGLGPIFGAIMGLNLAYHLICGLCSAVSLPEPYMITWQVCSLYVMAVKACRRSSVAIWE